MRINTILYATDFSEASRSAFPLAYSLARDHGARVIALHVVPAGTYEIANLVQLGHGESVRQFEQELWHDLQRLQPPDGSVPMEYKLEKGDPATLITKVAEETACDLIVVGTHGRTGLSRVLMGSVAENVLRSAPCPVLVAKTSVSDTGQPATASLERHEMTAGV
jgi:nucleotide-binding universal stress UspA family protein